MGCGVVVKGDAVGCGGYNLAILYNDGAKGAAATRPAVAIMR